MNLLKYIYNYCLLLIAYCLLLIAYCLLTVSTYIAWITCTICDAIPRQFATICPLVLGAQPIRTSKRCLCKIHSLVFCLSKPEIATA